MDHTMDHKQAAAAIAAWARAGQGEPLPAWDDLPAIPLYMDQVILYLSESLRLFQPEGEPSLLTSSMINNYVKNGLIPHPEKKKYRKEHLAGLIVLCLLKQVLPIPDVKALFSGRAMDAAAYQLFRQAHNAALQETCRALENTCRQEEDLPGLLALLGRAGFAGTLVTEVYRRSFGGEEELAASLEFTKKALRAAFS